MQIANCKLKIENCKFGWINLQFAICNCQFAIVLVFTASSVGWCSDHTHQRAGNPQHVAWYAKPSRSAGYCGGYVGGGSVFKGTGPTAEEGTWGWDYQGHRLLPRVWLNWSRGSRYQGGTGAYKTDGPHVPNVFDGNLYHQHLKPKTNE